MEAAAIESMDTFWQSTYDFLHQHFSPETALIVPDAWLGSWPNGAAPHQTVDRNPSEFHAIVVHKGDFEAFAAKFLRRAIQTHHAAFANEVFIVLVAAEARTKAMVASPMHAQPLRQIEQWARFQTAGAQPDGAKGHALTRGDLLDRMSRFIRHRLVKQVGQSEHKALSETEHTFNNTDWFWIDDTAKAAELLCLPRLRAVDPILTDRLIDFIVRMSQGPFIHRRVGPPTLRVELDSPADFRINNPFTILHGDLTRGRIYVAIRYNDGRTQPLTCLTSNVVSARWRGRTYSWVVEKHIVDQDIAVMPDRIVVSYTSRLVASDRQATVLGNVTYSFALYSDRPDIGVTVTMTPERGRLLRNVKLTATFGECGHNGSMDRARVLYADGRQDAFSPVTGHMKLARTPFKYMNLDESQRMHGFATGLHAVTLAPDKLIEVAANASENGHFGEISNLYRQAWATSWHPLTISEIRMVTGGGFYEYPEYYHQLMTEQPPIAASVDPSMSYDLGAELNSVAAYLRFAHLGQYEAAAPSPERLAELKAWVDRHLAIYFAHAPLETSDQHHAIFVRGLAFIVLALDTMHRTFAEESYAQRIALSPRCCCRSSFRWAASRTTRGCSTPTSIPNSIATSRPCSLSFARCNTAPIRTPLHWVSTGACGRSGRRRSPTGLPVRES
jgi:hypothetical protein